MDSIKLNQVLDAQQEIIQQIAVGNEISSLLPAICTVLEMILDDPKARVVITPVDQGLLQSSVAPNLPDNFAALTQGIEIGESMGACATAILRKKMVIIDDISNSPLCNSFAEQLRGFGLAACWSAPMIAANDQVLGSFAIYYTESQKPTTLHLELLERFSRLAGMAILFGNHEAQNKKLLQQLRHSNEKLSAMTAVMPDLALVISEEGEYINVYGSTDNLLYAPEKEIIGKFIQDIMPEHEAKPIMEVIQKTLATGDVQIFEYELQVLKGSVVFEGRTAPILHYNPEQPDKQHILWMARDITERKHSEQEIQQLAFYDPLTNLPNRRLLLDRLMFTIDRVKRSNKVGCLLFLDLDDFKRINDSLGHSVGDKLLLQVANRLQPLLRQSDTIARIGGDEFVVMLDSLRSHPEHTVKEASLVAKKLLEAFETPVSTEEADFKIGLSIGISLISGDTVSADDVLMHADTAMYRSKERGGNSYTFYDPYLQNMLDTRLKIENDIINALSENHFVAYFQPQVNIFDQVIGAEALIRLIHPERGIIPPDMFIPVAEQFGLINQLQQVVLEDVCRLYQQLKQQDIMPSDFHLSINISGSQFKSANLKQDLLNTIQAYQVPIKHIKLEITESMLVHDIDATISQMLSLKEEGFSFSIDDFGTGYSSLTYLHAFPIDELKVDKSFVDKILEGDVGINIVDTIVALANNLNFEVVVEGVESQQQVDILSQRAIDAMQGYYYAKPMPQEDFICWLRDRPH